MAIKEKKIEKIVYETSDEACFDNFEMANKHELTLNFSKITKTRIDYMCSDIYTVNSQIDLDSIYAYAEYYGYELNMIHYKNVDQFPKYLLWHDDGDAFFVTQTLYNELYKLTDELEKINNDK